VTYLVDEGRKYVLYWSMDHVRDTGDAVDPSEVAEVCWLAPDAALGVLTYPGEKAVLEGEILRGRCAGKVT
jgi:hypothetical protein